jgi:hypothetical protein
MGFLPYLVGRMLIGKDFDVWLCAFLFGAIAAALAMRAAVKVVP